MQYSGAGGASVSFSAWREGSCMSDPALFCRRVEKRQLDHK
jgi:hypothetical protein